MMMHGPKHKVIADDLEGHIILFTLLEHIAKGNGYQVAWAKIGDRMKFEGISLLHGEYYGYDLCT